MILPKYHSNIYCTQAHHYTVSIAMNYWANHIDSLHTYPGPALDMAHQKPTSIHPAVISPYPVETFVL